MNKVSVFMMLLHPALIMYVWKYAGTEQNFLRIENTAMLKGIVNEKEQIYFLRWKIIFWIIFIFL